jgi:hypothetical protein
MPSASHKLQAGKVTIFPVELADVKGELAAQYDFKIEFVPSRECGELWSRECRNRRQEESLHCKRQQVHAKCSKQKQEHHCSQWLGVTERDPPAMVAMLAVGRRDHTPDKDGLFLLHRLLSMHARRVVHFPLFDRAALA